jgi:hypothetical protein
MIPLEWADKARDQFADIWVAATLEERQQIEPQIVQLQRDLVDDPFAVGESRSEYVRVVILLPLVIWFSVFPDRVRIFRVTRPR